MEIVQNAVLSAVPNVGDITTYDAILEGLTSENRRYLPDALRDLKRKGKIVKWVEVVDGVTLHNIKREAL